MEILEVLLSLKEFQPTSSLLSQEAASSLPWAGLSLPECHFGNGTEQLEQELQQILGIQSWKKCSQSFMAIL